MDYPYQNYYYNAMQKMFPCGFVDKPTGITLLISKLKAVFSNKENESLWPPVCDMKE